MMVENPTSWTRMVDTRKVETMTPEELQELARLVAREIANDDRGAARAAVAAVAPRAVDALAGDADELSCFTCSGRFACRPSFLIQAKTAEDE
jgi:hypothetical protein